MKTLLLLITQLFFVSASFSEINAIYNNDKVEISWNNPKHIKVDYFIVERSKNGKKFKEMLMIKASENNGNTIEYFEVDYKPFSQKAYYRIKQIDVDGYIYYSEMVMAQNFENIKPLFKLFPDSKSNSKLKEYEEKDILVVLFNSKHEKFVARVDITTENKRLIMTHTNEFLPTGEYLIIATSDDTIYGKKITVDGNYSIDEYTLNK